MDEIRLSVRALVEFTLHGEDISPSASSSLLLEGTLAHQARQGLLPEDYVREKTLSHRFLLFPEGPALHLSGRMDAFRDGPVPLIEEMKLGLPGHLPEAPVPAHWAQAVVYAHLLMLDRSELSCIAVRLVYVAPSGDVLRTFSEDMDRIQCEALFQSLLQPYKESVALSLAHRKARNRALHDLCFPFPVWRDGQRALAEQVYTAIRREKRLFASLPTGTGKSMGVLFPALKAMGEERTEQIFYLTCRTTQRQGPLDALARITERASPLHAMVLESKESLCPFSLQCHPLTCERARGHFLRDGDALLEMRKKACWMPSDIRETADRYRLCPFAFSLALCDYADLVICDLNYVFDPLVRLQRLFQTRHAPMTLLIDEAHHLPERLRDMFTGRICGQSLRKIRTACRRGLSKEQKSQDTHVGQLTSCLQLLPSLLPQDDTREGFLSVFPEPAMDILPSLISTLTEIAASDTLPMSSRPLVTETLRELLRLERGRSVPENCTRTIYKRSRYPTLERFCVSVASLFADMTRDCRGVIIFSATLEPLDDMKRILGGEDDDACFLAPSPFPRENLLIHPIALNTRYAARPASVACITETLCTLWDMRPGRYMVFFPSFAYLQAVSEKLHIPHQCQERQMTADARMDFLRPYHTRCGPCLSLCVLGGLFSEGIDLPGDALEGVVIIGIGLPQISLHGEALKSQYAPNDPAGFAHAYAIPGLQKVIQAVGRVIRTETDRGFAILMDDRYGAPYYRMLLPRHWDMQSGSLTERLTAFWNGAENSRKP